MEEGTGLIVLSIAISRRTKAIRLLCFQFRSFLLQIFDAKTRGVVERIYIYNLPMRSVLSHKDDSLARKTPPPSHSRGFILEFQVNETTFFDRITT